MPASIPSITVLLPREVKRSLTRLAEREGMKVGPFVRRLIERELTYQADDEARRMGRSSEASTQQ